MPPTQEQIDQVHKNAGNIIDFTNNLHVYFSDRINEVYSEISADQSRDSGYEFLCAILETVFSVAELVEFPGAAFAGAFLPLLFSASSPKGAGDINSDLDFAKAATFARLVQTMLNANLALAEINANPAAYWDQTFTSPLTGRSTPVSGLGDPGFVFPKAEDPNTGVAFVHLTERVAAQFKRDLTKSLLPDYCWSYYSEYYSGVEAGPLEDFFNTCRNNIKGYPAYFFRYRPVSSNGQTAYQTYNFSLCPKGSRTSTVSDQFARWLFKDDGFGQRSDYEGFADKAEVLFSWGLERYYSNSDGSGSSDKPPFGFDQTTVYPNGG